MPINTKVVSLNPVHGEVYLIQHYVIKFVSDLRQVGGFFLGTLVSSTNKTDHHDIAEILLEMALNTIHQTKPTWQGHNVVLRYSFKTYFRQATGWGCVYEDMSLEWVGSLAFKYMFGS